MQQFRACISVAHTSSTTTLIKNVQKGHIGPKEESYRWRRDLCMDTEF